jgi:hypothetical protein
MTQQVKNGYQDHKRTTWGFALLLALAVGAILIPLASGGGGKTYTLSVSPSSFCAGATNTSTVTITNTARTQTLGSAELFFPGGSISSVSRGGQDITSTVLTSGAAGASDMIGPFNNLNLSFGKSFTLTVTYASGAQSGSVQAVVKQANTFNDAGGGANLFDNPAWPSLTFSTCHYVFTGPPADAGLGQAQTVKVQLQNGTGAAVPAAGPLTLTVQGGTPAGSFTGLASSAQDASNTWVFNSLTGNQSGIGYQLEAGSDLSNTFNIWDCSPIGGTCSTPLTLNDSTSGGSQVSGTGLASGFNVSFASTLPDTARGICEANGWTEMTFDGGRTFDGITTTTTSYSPGGTGSMLVTLYFRNDLYVQTQASQTNSIQLCAGAMHTNMVNKKDPATAWMGANGVRAVYVDPADNPDDSAAGLYWGVLQRIPNCNSNKVPVDSKTGIKSPALCAWGTTPIDGVSYRTATMIVPYDWDFYPKG